MRSPLLAFLAGFAAELAYAIPNTQPAPTRVVHDEYDPFGWSPNPTQGPSLELLKRANVFHAKDKRQATLSSGQLVGYFAPDTMCGYISGSLGATLACSSSSRCAAIAAIGNIPGAVGCCPVGQSGCYFITTCYNSVDIASGKCDHGCQQDVDVRLCSASASPSCYGYIWPDISATIWGCAASTASTKDTVLFTFIGETDGRSWSAYYYTPTGSNSASDGGIISLVSKSIGNSSASSTSSSSSSSGSSSGGGGGSSHTGAIVGGVVGGIAVLGATVLAVVFLLLRKKKHDNAAAAQSGYGPGYGPGGASPNGGASGHSPHHMSAVPAGAAGAAVGGYYGHDHKTSEVGTPHGQHANMGPVYMQQQHQQPYKDPNSPYDRRVSQMSEIGTPISQYAPPGHMQTIPQAPMELDASSSAQHINAQGQPIYEAPADVPSPHRSPTGAVHSPLR